MKERLPTYSAMLGLLLVIASIISRYAGLISVNNRTTFLVIGFALMLLGTIWKVVLEMNEKDS